MPRVFDRNNPPACVRLPARPSATIFTFPAAGADGGQSAIGNRQSESPIADCRMPIAKRAANVAGPHLVTQAAAMATPGGSPTAWAAPHEPEASALRDAPASGFTTSPPHHLTTSRSHHLTLSPAAQTTHLATGYAIGTLMTLSGIMLCVGPGHDLDILAGAGTGLAVIVTVLGFVVGADRFAASASGGRRAEGVSPEANTVSPEAKE